MAPGRIKRYGTGLLGMLRAFVRCQRGLAAIEFALLSTILLTVLMGLVDYGMAMFRKIELENAVRSGAQYALLRGHDSSVISTVVKDSTNLSDVTVSSVCLCTDPAGNSNNCTNSACSGLAWYVTITAANTFDTFFLPADIDLSESLTIRIQ